MATAAQSIRTQLSSRSFVESFSANVRRFPDAPALAWQGEPVSYRELNDRALARQEVDLVQAVPMFYQLLTQVNRDNTTEFSNVRFNTPPSPGIHFTGFLSAHRGLRVEYGPRIEVARHLRSTVGGAG